MHYIKDLQNYIRAILMFYTTIVQIFTLKQKNQMNLDYMVLAKNIVQSNCSIWVVMDGNGIPLADYAFAGNMNEQPTLRKLEQKIEEDFQLKKFIVVADAGLNGWENKVYNNMKNNHAYIVTQPIKKLKKSLQEWAIDPSGWRISGSREKFNLQDIMNAAENAETDLKHYKINIDGTERNVYDLIFYKERWEKTTKNLT